MREFTACKESADECLQSKRFTVAYLHSEEKTMEMHIHRCHEIYYSISGGKQFFIGDKCYDIEPGDLFIINQYESHYLSQRDDVVHDRIVFSIHPDFLVKLSTEHTDLSHCFLYREDNYSHRLRLDKESQNRLIYLAHKITSTSGYGADVIENAAFLELMVMINRQFQKHDPDAQPSQKYHYNELVGDILDYINENITQKISISSIADRFFLSESYVCRLFKAETGTTINKYLSARRISIAKTLLAGGCSAAEACEKSGFNDYTNFIKAFTKAVGISPKRFSINAAN